MSRRAELWLGAVYAEFCIHHYAVCFWSLWVFFFFINKESDTFGAQAIIFFISLQLRG